MVFRVKGISPGLRGYSLLAAVAHLFQALMVCGAISWSGAYAEEVSFHRLSNDQLSLALTPNFGGLVTEFSLVGRENVLLVGEAIQTQPNPEVSPESGHIPYMGHTVWAGPQSEWWAHQNVNPERRDQRAPWPPDPYAALAKNTVVEASDTQVVLQGPASPVSGLQFRKVFQLVEETENAVDLRVEASNTRGEPVAWDIWFNTRVPVSAKVYVPAASMNHVRVEQHVDDNFGPLRHKLEDGLFSLDKVAPVNGKQGRRGKAFIDPSAGWIAAFIRNQLFVIAFPLQPSEAIHPEQGQVELYLSHHRQQTQDNLLELEVHAPYKQLAPGQSMAASERWYLLPYEGEDSRSAHVAFLQNHLPERLAWPRAGL